MSNNEEGHQQLLALFADEKPGRIVLEATGGYERAVLHTLSRAGHAVSRLNPTRVRAFATAMGKLAKTDPIDAAVLAHLAQTLEEAPSQPLSPERERLRELGLDAPTLEAAPVSSAAETPPPARAESSDGRAPAFALRSPRHAGRNQEQSPGPPKACSGAKGVSLTSLPSNERSTSSTRSPRRPTSGTIRTRLRRSCASARRPSRSST